MADCPALRSFIDVSFFWQSSLQPLLKRWLRFRSIAPETTALNVAANDRLVYVLDHDALSDQLALDSLRAQTTLPGIPADSASEPGQTLPAHVALNQLKRNALRGPQKHPSPKFDALLERLQTDDQPDVVFLPVSFFWGRRPGRETRGIWRLMTADRWPLSGRFRRLLSLAFNGRHIDVRYGTPYRASDLLTSSAPSQAHARRRSIRFLNRQFRQRRQEVLGPDLSHRRTLVRTVTQAPEVRQQIRQTHQAHDITLERATKRARRYAREIASHTSPRALWLMYKLLGQLWNRLYNGVNVTGLDRVRALAGTHELIYVPCHRSHIDYLLLSYVIYHHGLTTPQIAAGKNLDMPGIGAVLRRGGAFFIRRSFKGNALYGAVFNEYLHQLITRGYPVEYFIEGGRSRTGRMLPPKLGMLAMTLRSYVREPNTRPMAFIPVYIGYEKVLESGAYQKELTTGKKKAESPFDLVRVIKRLRQPFGQVHVNIGEPLALDYWLDAQQPDWRTEPTQDWHPAAVRALGKDVVQRINEAATLNGVNLVALALLSTSHQAMEESLLEAQIETLNALQRLAPATRHVMPADGTPVQWIEHAIHLGMVKRVPQALGPIIVVQDNQTALLTWYRNNVLHLFARFALVAFAFRHHTRLTLEELEHLVGPMWPALDNEFFLPGVSNRSHTFDTLLHALKGQGLLEYNGEYWTRPTRKLIRNEQLMTLGSIIVPTLERGYLLVSLLLRAPSGSYTQESLEGQSQALAERLTLLQGVNAPEYFDKRLFQGLLQTLTDEGWCWEDDAGVLHIHEELKDALNTRRRLFDPALRQRLIHLLATKAV
nr:glycerol-3-phosphate 1-O-acyltransferase PlsB [Larsenimonas salina]